MQEEFEGEFILYYSSQEMHINSNAGYQLQRWSAMEGRVCSEKSKRTRVGVEWQGLGRHWQDNGQSCSSSMEDSSALTRFTVTSPVAEET